MKIDAASLQGLETPPHLFYSLGESQIPHSPNTVHHHEFRPSATRSRRVTTDYLWPNLKTSISGKCFSKPLFDDDNDNFEADFQDFKDNVSKADDKEEVVDVDIKPFASYAASDYVASSRGNWRTLRPKCLNGQDENRQDGNLEMLVAVATWFFQAMDTIFNFWRICWVFAMMGETCQNMEESTLAIAEMTFWASLSMIARF